MKMELQDDSGQALVEFALFISLLILILAGMTDYAIYIRQQMVLNEAVAAGAQFGIIPGNQENFSGMQAVAQNAGKDLSSMVVPMPVNIYTCTPGGAQVTNMSTCLNYGTPIMYVQVTASATVPAAVRWSGLINQNQLTATATYRVPWTK